MIAVGIGCIWFADVRRQLSKSDEFSPEDHLELIKSVLEGIDNISNVKVIKRGKDLYISTSRSDEDEDENFFPIFSSVKISFDIFMPERVQQRHSIFGRAEKGVENFHVVLAYDNHMPVLYVYYDVFGGEIDCNHYSPSWAIVFIRNYLTDKLKGHPKIDFQFLGPSPFHADFFINKCGSESLQPIIKDISILGGGYGTFYFELPDPTNNIIDSFIANSHSIFSSYYRVIRYRNRTNRLGRKTANGTEQLYSHSQTRRFPSSVFYWFQNGKIIDEVYKSILDQKMNDISLSRFIANAKADDNIDESHPVYSYIERATKDQFMIPTEHVKDILKMLEDRRQGYIRNTTTVVSGLIGGILGATLTFLLGFHSTGSAIKALPVNGQNSTQTLPHSNSQ